MLKRIKKVRFNDIPEVYEFEGDGIASLVLPFVKNVLPKVLTVHLGLAAATGAVSGAANKKASGRSIGRINTCTTDYDCKEMYDCKDGGKVLEGPVELLKLVRVT